MDLGAGTGTYTRYHSTPTAVIQHFHTLLFDFPSGGGRIFYVFGVVEEVNANPGKTSTDLSNQQVCGLFILIGVV